MSAYSLFWRGHTDMWLLVLVPALALALGIWPYDATQAAHRHKSRTRAMIVGIVTPVAVLLYCAADYWQKHGG